MKTAWMIALALGMSFQAARAEDVLDDANLLLSSLAGIKLKVIKEMSKVPANSNLYFKDGKISGKEPLPQYCRIWTRESPDKLSSFTWKVGKETAMETKGSFDQGFYFSSKADEKSISGIMCVEVEGSSSRTTLADMKEAFGPYFEITVPTIEGRRIKSTKPTDKQLHRGSDAPQELKDKDAGKVDAAS